MMWAKKVVWFALVVVQMHTKIQRGNYTSKPLTLQSKILTCSLLFGHILFCDVHIIGVELKLSEKVKVDIPLSKFALHASIIVSEIHDIFLIENQTLLGLISSCVHQPSTSFLFKRTKLRMSNDNKYIRFHEPPMNLLILICRRLPHDHLPCSPPNHPNSRTRSRKLVVRNITYRRSITMFSAVSNRRWLSNWTHLLFWYYHLQQHSYIQ